MSAALTWTRASESHVITVYQPFIYIQPESGSAPLFPISLCKDNPLCLFSLLAGVTIQWTNAPLVGQQRGGKTHSPLLGAGPQRINSGHTGRPPPRNVCLVEPNISSQSSPTAPSSLSHGAIMVWAVPPPAPPPPHSHRVRGASLGLSLLRSHPGRGSLPSLAAQSAGTNGKLDPRQPEASGSRHFCQRRRAGQGRWVERRRPGAVPRTAPLRQLSSPPLRTAARPQSPGPPRRYPEEAAPRCRPLTTRPGAHRPPPGGAVAPARPRPRAGRAPRGGRGGGAAPCRALGTRLRARGAKPPPSEAMVPLWKAVLSESLLGRWRRCRPAGLGAGGC